MAVIRPYCYDSTGTLKPMSNADMAYTSWVVRNNWASTEEPGHLRVNSQPAGWVSVGSMADRYRAAGLAERTEDIWGSFPDPTDPGTTTTTYTFYQNRNTVAVPNAALKEAGPVYSLSGSYQDIRPWATNITDQDIIDTFIDPVMIQDVEAGGAGRYYLGTTTPANYTDLGYTFTNFQVDAGSFAGPTNRGNWFLSKRTVETAPAVVRPLRIDGNNGLIGMSDAEIIAFFKPYFVNRVNVGSRLVYTLGGSTTGIDCGSYTDTYYSGMGGVYLVSGHTYRQSVATLTTTTSYLRLANT